MCLNYFFASPLDPDGTWIGEERIKQVQAEWQDLFDQARAEMAKGTDPASKPVKVLARRSIGLIPAIDL